MFDAYEPLADDDLFELLDNPRRRLLLYYLFDSDDGIHISDLSREIVAFEAEVPLEEVDDDEVTSVYVSLYQTHIPTLEDHDVVEYDDDERVVTLGTRADDIVPILRDSRTHRRRWGRYYLAVALPFGAVELLLLLQLVDVSRVLESALTVGGASALLLLAVGHYYVTRLRPPRESTLEDLAC